MAGWFPPGSTSAPPAGAPPAAAPPPGAPPAAQPPSTPSLTHQFITLPDGTQAIGDLTQNPDGSFTVASGTYAGLQLNAQRQPDPKSLALVQSVQAGQTALKGMGLPAGSYSVNPDGSIKIINHPGNGPWEFTPIGETINPDGSVTNPDGTPKVDSNGKPVLSPTTPTGGQTSAWVHSNEITNLVTKDNPIAGTVNAAEDIASGKYRKAASDFGAGSSGGTLPQVDDKGNIVPGDTTKKVATDAGVPNDIPGVTSPVTGPGGIADDLSKLVNGLKDIGGGGSSPVDTSAAKADHDRAMALADALSGQANAAGAQADTDRGLVTQTRQQQEDSIAGLQAAANGTAPSAAELQLKQQAGIDAARQYGLAAALQGNNPGAALRQASMGAAQVAGTTNQNAAINRANEQATARGLLATTLGNVRTGDQSNVNTDINQQTNLNTASGTASGQGTTSTGQQITAQTEKDKADALKTGALVGAGGTLLSTILSDKRAKKNIAKADLADALGKEVHGVTFTYKPEVEEDDDPHFGILADALEKVIPGVVKKGPSGFKEVHTGHLALANVGVTAELARRLQDLEKGKGARR